MSGFDDAYRAVIAVEGGTSNDPNDAGGLTCAGITQVTAMAAYVQKLVSTDDPRRLTEAERRVIYKTFYWDRVVFPGMKDAHAVILFDAAVNCGVGSAVKFLQRAMNELLRVPITVDGVLGPGTKRAYRTIMTASQFQCPDLCDEFLCRTLAALLLEQRVAYYADITDGAAVTSARRKQEIANRKFLRGWLMRVRRWLGW